MVTIEVRKKYLLGLVGKKISDSELGEALHQIKAPIDATDGETLAIEVTGDRPDLLSAEGIARSLKGYLGLEKGIPEEKFQKGNLILHVDPSVKGVREFIVAAVIEGVNISDADLKDLIQIQEKLTLTHGRKRKKVAIGLHDMRMLAPPFHYKAVGPDSLSFVPLGKTQKMTLREIVGKHEKGIDYGGIVSSYNNWPIIMDSKNQVLSFPPVINGTLTEIATSTKSIFVDITGTDFHACNIALNILCQDFYDRGAKVKTVEVRYNDRFVITPETAPEIMDLNINAANSLLGVELSPSQIISALAKQRISASIKNERSLECQIPRYRADFLHQVDLIEEVALGFGYNNFEPKPPSLFTKGSLLQRTKLIDSITDLMIGAGFLEINTPILTNMKVAQKSLTDLPQIRIKNPVSEEYGAVRSSLLPQMLETLSRNMHNPYPQKAFQLGLVALPDDKSETRASNELHLAAIFANSDANLVDLSGILLELLNSLKIAHILRKSDLKMFIGGRQVSIDAKIGGKHFPAIASIGEIHPAVLENFKLEVPVCAFEISLEPFSK